MYVSLRSIRYLFNQFVILHLQFHAVFIGNTVMCILNTVVFCMKGMALWNFIVLYLYGFCVWINLHANKFIQSGVSYNFRGTNFLQEGGHIHISNILFLEIHLFDRNAVFSRIFEYWTKTGYIRVLQNRMEGTNQASSHHAKGQKKTS